MRIAVDTGGTFTDCVFLAGGRLRVLKLLSTPADPAQALLDALARLPRAQRRDLRHGTTVGTNALLERTGSRVAFITTAGFEDTIAIGRQARPALFDWTASPPAPLAPARLRFGVAERTLPGGKILLPLAPAALRRLVRQVRAARPEAIAVSLLFSFANPRHERALARALAPLGVPITLSHRLLPEFREFERGAAVLINAYLAPGMSGYLRRLDRATAGVLHVMQSSGGITTAAAAAREPVRTILSGPAGGVVGACAVARRAGFSEVLSFDMGGTSTDVALAGPDGPSLSAEARVEGLPLAIPTLDIHTVGAGGGSIARFDRGGLLRVGPESAGADPGPACFGRGTLPTVTDAHLLLGRLAPEAFLGGGFALDTDRARTVFERTRGPIATVEAFAEGILAVADAAMEKALRLVSIERGHDPRASTLVAFGGAGPLHAAGLARRLHIPRVLIPAHPGALSALGILLADQVRDLSQTVMLDPARPATAAALERHFRRIERHLDKRLERDAGPGNRIRSLDLRYAGQGYELNIPASPDPVTAFHRAHRERYGYADPSRPVEIVNLRLRLIRPSPPLPWRARALRAGNGSPARLAIRPARFEGRVVPTPIYDRGRLRPGDRFLGPALVVEYSATTVVPPGVGLAVDRHANLILSFEAAHA